MARKFSAPKLYIDHEPDSHFEVDGDGVKQHSELPGFLELGVEVNGVKIPLHRLKAGTLLQQFDAAAAKSDTPAADDDDSKTDS